MSSFGEELKRERELREISLREISEATKISLRYLESLERNDFTHLPGGVFNKGFVRAYAQYIGVDPETMVNAYLLEEQAQRRGQHDPEMFRPAAASRVAEAAPEGGRPGFSLVRVALVALVLAGIAGGVLLAWWWWTNSGESAPAETRETSPPSSTAATPVPVAGEPAGTEEDPVEQLLDPHLERPDEVVARASVGPTAGSDPVDRPARPKAEPATGETSPADAGPDRRSAMRVTLQRPTQGRLNCDDRRVEILDGAAAGTELVFHCSRFLVIDADDAGAVLLQKGDADAAAVGADGAPVAGLYVVPPGAGMGNPS